MDYNFEGNNDISEVMLLIRGILILPGEDNLHISELLCYVLFIIWAIMFSRI